MSINEAIQTQEKNEVENPKAKNDALISIPSQNQTEADLKVHLEELLYITSEGNYLNIYLHKKEATRCEVIRNTLKNIYPKFDQYPDIFQCHRAFIVNTKKIKSVEGNAQGYRIKLDAVESQIPVSRSYVKDFRDKILNT